MDADDRLAPGHHKGDQECDAELWEIDFQASVTKPSGFCPGAGSGGFPIVTFDLNEYA